MLRVSEMDRQELIIKECALEVEILKEEQQRQKKNFRDLTLESLEGGAYEIQN